MLRRFSVVTIAMAWAGALPAQQRGPALKLGKVHFENSCSASVQPTFNRAVALLHSFEFRDAVEAFSETIKADPRCGIAYWGIALSNWGNPFVIGARPQAQIRRGLDAIQNARAAGSGSPREADFVSAAANLYQDYQTIDQPGRLRAYRDAMSRLASRYDKDIEASIFYALSLAASADPAEKTYRDQHQAGRILEKLVARYPEHPGLAHYIIHSYDVPSLAGRALHAANRYALIAPSAAHALHMPSHTFTRLGYWLESISTNAASAAAARRVDGTSEELHASDYLMYAYLQTGQDRAAHRLLTSLPSVIARFDPAKPTGAAPASAAFFAIAAIPARYALERGQWKDAARLDILKSPVPWANAVSHFARALGAARGGDTTLARAEIAELGRIRDQLAEQKEPYWAEQTTIQLLDASAWLALAGGNSDAALTIMREAVLRESATDKSAVTPGPLVPARELLGEMLLQLGQPGAALKEFQTTLRTEPSRFRSLAGAVKASRAAGDRAAARRYSAHLLKVASRGDKPGRSDIATAKKLVGGS